MTEMRAIEIDFEVHKRIELERTSFSETPNDVLRRKYGIVKATLPVAATPPVSSDERAWSGKSVELPHGTELRFDYNGRLHFGRIDNGRWLVDGQYFTSPSGAAGAVAITKAGNKTKLDGWTHWHVKRPTDTGWILIDKLRKGTR